MSLFNATVTCTAQGVAITVTAQATNSPDRYDKQTSKGVETFTWPPMGKSIHLAISGDLQLATNGDFQPTTASE
jgi:hypothetical protein